jgi:protein SCO1/2/putative membrane protein
MSVHSLPALNALLNGISFVLLLIGYALIRRGRRAAHQRVMIAALVSSALFLTSYLVYHAHVGSVRFRGQGPVRTVYFTILLTHTVLAATVPFLAAVTVTRAFRKRYPRHVAIARWTLPIWLYVSITGVVIYWMLYRLGVGGG